MIGLVVLVNIGIRADSSQRDLIRSRAELNAVTYADHMKADIVRGIDITNTFEQIVISENGKNFHVLESCGEYDGRLCPEYSDRTRRRSD